MLESLQVSFSAIAPIFLLLSLGYGIKKIRLVEESVFAALNKLIFRVFCRFCCSIISIRPMCSR